MIMNNDFNEGVYTFAVKGEGVSPEINVSGNSVSIPAGNMAYVTADNTDFGSTFLNLPVVKVFEVQNTGTGTLSLSNITINGNNSSEFTFITNMSFPMNIAAASNYSFAIQYLPQTLGTRTAQIVVTNNDADESSYSYMITAKAMMDVGITQFANDVLSVSVFPNPAAEQATLHITAAKASEMTISVISLDGKTVLSQTAKVNAGTSDIKLNTSALSNGVYFVNFKQGNKTNTIKVVIAN
jgi:hypothetical protein